MKREFFTAQDGKQINIAIWDEVANPKCVIQIVHGMSEHIARYDDFANFLNKNGYIVFGDDHRGHGLTDPDDLGLQGDGDLFENTVSDEKELTNFAKQKYNLPIILFGHSYGSFITQRYLSYGSENLSGVVLCGSAFMSGFSVLASRILTIGKEKDKPSNTFANLTFRSYDKKIKDGENAWLTRDKEIVKQYNNDRFCGFVCSNGFYHCFFKGLREIEKSPHTNLDKSLPMLLIAGDGDYVGNCGRLVIKLKKRYEKLGLAPKLILYKGARHELINETNRDEVYKDVLSFFQNCLK